MRFVVLFVLALSLPASAQLTWKNLHFGQSRDDVRTQLRASGMEVETSQENSLQSTADYELALPGLARTLPMHAGFHFNDANGLADVTLWLDLAGMRRYWAALGPEEALYNFAAEKLTVALSGRYGPPLYRSPDCDKAPQAPTAFCTLGWRGPDQLIEMERSPAARGPRLVIRYQPLAADL